MTEDGELSQKEIDDLLSGNTCKTQTKSDASKAELSKNEIADLLSIIESVPTQDTSVSDPFLNNVSKRLVADMPVYFNTALGTSFSFSFGSLDKITYESFLRSVSSRTIMTFAKWGNKVSSCRGNEWLPQFSERTCGK